MHFDETVTLIKLLTWSYLLFVAALRFRSVSNETDDQPNNGKSSSRYFCRSQVNLVCWL